MDTNYLLSCVVVWLAIEHARTNICRCKRCNLSSVGLMAVAGIINIALLIDIIVRYLWA